MLYNALIKSALEYCCTVWGNCSREQLTRLLAIQKLCARSSLDANPFVNSVTLLNTLKWIPIDDTLRILKLCMMYRIIKNYWMRLSRISELFRQRSALSAEAEG